MSHLMIGRCRRATAPVLALAALMALLAIAIHPVRSEPTPGPRLAPGSLLRPDQSASSSGEAAKVQAAYGQLPLTFVPNRGQADPRVRYSARAAGLELSFTSEEVVMAFGGVRDGDLALRFVGANPSLRIEGEREAPGKVNYLLGDGPSEWRTGLPTYEAVRYRDLWPGIDVVFRGAKGALKYDFILQPGAPVEDIRLAYRGAEGLWLDVDGSLRIRTAAGTLTDERPVSWQEIAGKRVPVSSRYLLHRGAGGETECGFAVGPEYDAAHPLVIDPSLAYGTYLGGSSTEEAWAVALDASGSACVTGWTNSSNYPVTSGAYSRKRKGMMDAFITKLNAAGTGLVFSTYLGGTGDDQAREIALDSAGNIYVAGDTASASAFPLVNAHDTTLSGPWDAFLTKLNPTGSSVLYSTYLGGSGQDTCWGGLAVRNAQEVYVAGHTTSQNFPLVGAFDVTLDGGQDTFVATFDTTSAGAASLVRSSFLGGTSTETLHGLAMDSLGNAYLTGWTWSADFVSAYGLQTGAYDDELSPDPSDPDGLRDAFLAVVSDGGILTYATYRGGSGGVGAGDSLALYEPVSGGPVWVYLAGRVRPTSILPTTPNAYDTTQNGGEDLYLMVLRPDPADSNTGGPDADELEYATFLGGSGTDRFANVAADSAGNAYLDGQTSSANFPTTNAFDTTLNGATDLIVAKLTPAGGGASDLVYSSYLGGSSDEEPGQILVDGAGSAYVVGETFSNGLFPGSLPGYDKSKSGTTDAFVVKVNP